MIFNYRKYSTNFRPSPCVQVHENSQIPSQALKIYTQFWWQVFKTKFSLLGYFTFYIDNERAV